MSNYSGLYAAVSGALGQEKRLEILANNLANVNTTGYKKDVLSFRALLSAAEKARGMSALVAMDTFGTDFSQGNLRNTGNPLDMAVSGKGFFEVMTPEGPRYTRQGSFSLNASMQLVAETGDPVSADGGVLVLDGTDISVGHDGEVTVDGESAGRIKMVSFVDLEKLEKSGAGFFRNGGGDENLTEDPESSIVQGALEYSNVDQVKEMVQLIEISRAYESFQKIIQSMDDASKKLINEVGSL